MNAEIWRRIVNELVQVAVGHKPADLIIQGGHWVCVQSGEIVRNADIAIKGERIAYVGHDASHTLGKTTQIISAKDKYMVPGLIDGHTHIEMAMVQMGQFVNAVIPHGTTGAFIDPHEFANIVGLQGIRFIVDESRHQPIHIWVQMPSSVPCVPELETSGAIILADEVAEAMRIPDIVGLGEVMNYLGVANSDPNLLAIIAEALVAGRVIGGHYASSDLGLQFHGYVACGVNDDHEGTCVEDAIARARQGLKVMLRFNTGMDDLSPQLKAITECGLDPRHFILATDGITPKMLLKQGHMDYVVRQAISCGLPPITAIQMATINTAEHFGVARHVGQIAPVRYADIVIIDDLPSMDICFVIAKGKVVFDGKLINFKENQQLYPYEIKNSIRVGKQLTKADFTIQSPTFKKVEVNVIGMNPGKISTRHLKLKIEPKNGYLRADPDRDIAIVASVERHQATGKINLGFVHGFGLKGDCSVASTVSHDSHHMIIVGTDENCMSIAANTLISVGGGQVVVKDGEVLALIELPIAGLLSEKTIEQVVEEVEYLDQLLHKQCGCVLPSAVTQITRLGLIVIPELRLSNKGLIDVNHFQTIPLINENKSDELL